MINDEKLNHIYIYIYKIILGYVLFCFERCEEYIIFTYKFCEPNTDFLNKLLSFLRYVVQTFRTSPTNTIYYIQLLLCLSVCNKRDIVQHRNFFSLN